MTLGSKRLTHWSTTLCSTWDCMLDWCILCAMSDCSMIMDLSHDS